jgi:predicted DCC family thiol-disulfide oxidoreductase YuxK
MDRPFFRNTRETAREETMKGRNAYDDDSRDILVYDGRCPVCSGAMKWIQDNAVESSFDLLPCQSLQNSVPYRGIKRADCMQAMHLVLPNGTILAGEQALPEIVSRLRKYRFAGVLFKLPGASAVSRLAYRWFAVRRYRISAILSHLTGGRSGMHKMENYHERERSI